MQKRGCRIWSSWMQYLRALSTLGWLGLQVLADVPAGAEAPVGRLLVDLPDVAVRLGGHIPEGRGWRQQTPY